MPRKIPPRKLKEISAEMGIEACSLCQSPLKLEKVNLDQLKKGKLFVIENVEAYVCENCGEVWVPKPVLDEFEKMVKVVEDKNSKKRNK